MTVIALVPAATPISPPRTSPSRPTPAALRRVPPPATEPAALAFDGGTFDAVTSGHGHPTLMEDARPTPRESTGPSPLRIVESDGSGPQPTPRAALPDPRIWARRLVTAILEVQAGTRPPVQLARYLDDRVYASVRRARPERPSTGGFPAWRLRSIHMCEPGDGVVEATAVVERAGRYCAVALRLEGIGGRWICTVFEALIPQSAAAPTVRRAS